MVNPASLLAIEFCRIVEFPYVLTYVFDVVFARFAINFCYSVLRSLDSAVFIVRPWPGRPLRIILFLFYVSRGAVLDVRHLCRGAIVAHFSFVGRGAVNLN